MNKVETKDRIKEALEIRAMRQSDLVDKTGIDKGQLSSYISGKYKPKQTNLQLMAEALSVDEAWLMGYDVPMERSNNNAALHAKMAKDMYFQKLYTYWEKLSDVGKDKLIEYAVDLSKIYTKN